MIVLKLFVADWLCWGWWLCWHILWLTYDDDCVDIICGWLMMTGENCVDSICGRLMKMGVKIVLTVFVADWWWRCGDCVDIICGWLVIRGDDDCAGWLVMMGVMIVSTLSWILVWSFVYANDARLRRIHKRAVTHARKWIIYIVGGATAMSFGKQIISGPGTPTSYLYLLC